MAQAGCSPGMIIRQLDAEKAYRNLTPYRALIELMQHGWRVDYELKNRQAQGGGHITSWTHDGDDP